MIFEGWNPAHHIVEPSDIPEDWPRFYSADVDGPMLLWAKSPDGKLYLIGSTDQTTTTTGAKSNDQ